MLGMTLALIGASYTQEYIISRDLYEQMIGNSRLYPALESLVPWGYVFGYVIFIVLLWYLVASILNPAFIRFPFNPYHKSLRAWLTWLIGGLTFSVLVFAVASANLFGSYPDEIKKYEWLLLYGMGAVAWVVISSHGLGRMDRSFTENFRWQNLLRVAGQGLLFTGLLLLVDQIADYGLNAILILITESFFRSGEFSTAGYVWSWFGITVIGGMIFAITFGLLPLFKPGAGGLRARMTASRPALWLLGIVVVASLLVTPLLYSIHLLGDRTVAGVTGVDKIEPLSLSEIRLCTAGECLCNSEESSALLLEVREYDEDISGLGFLMQGGEVPLHPDIVPVLDQFLREHEHSVLRRSAMADVIELHRQLWQPLASHRVMEQLIREKHLESEPIIWTMLRAAWLERAAPINDETRRMLSYLSDETRFFISDHYAIKLANAWARFGDEQQMNRFLEQARQYDPEEYQDLDLQPAKLTSGQIKGQLNMPGDVAGIRVGLFRRPETPLQQAKARQSGKPQQEEKRSISFYWMNAVTSTILSSDGEFQFTNLGSGDYYLALLVPQDKLGGAEKVAGHHIPDAITLNTQHPKRDLAEIRLVPE